ncbi:MAG: VOC family protein [Chloroflexi bacterium]|nr:VOC family protein [Chloroflexota bacterium]
MLKAFAYHGVTVGDLDRSLAFYRDFLHMKVERTYEASGAAIEEATGLPGAHMRVAMLRFEDISGDHLLKLIQYLSPQGKKLFGARLCDVGASHISVCSDQVQQLYDELRARDVKFVSPPVSPNPQRPEAMFTYFLDPDGVAIELLSAKPHHAHVVGDMDRAVAFYRDVLGMKLDGTPRDITSQQVAIGLGFPDGAHLRSAHMILDTDEYVELHQYVLPEGKKQSEMRLCDVGCSYVAFDVDDVQRCYEELQARGVELISRPVHLTEEGSRVAAMYMLDPDAYAIELRTSAARP